MSFPDFCDNNQFYVIYAAADGLVSTLEPVCQLSGSFLSPERTKKLVQVSTQDSKAKG